MAPKRPPSSPRSLRTPAPAPLATRRLDVRHPLSEPQVEHATEASIEREQHCFEIANHIADLVGDAIVMKYFDSVAPDYTAAALWDTMMATMATSCQDHDRPAHPADVYSGVPAKRAPTGAQASSKASRCVVDASLPLAGDAKRARSPSQSTRHAQLALEGGNAGQGVDVLLDVVDSATNWSGEAPSRLWGKEASSPQRADSQGEIPGASGEGGRWRADALPRRIPCDEHSRYVAGILQVRAISPPTPPSPRRRAQTHRHSGFAAESTLSSTRLQTTSGTSRMGSARRSTDLVTPPAAQVTRPSSTSVSNNKVTPNSTPQHSARRTRPETARETANRLQKEEVEAEAERIRSERETEENLPPDVDLDCHRQLAERLHKERVSKETHDKRLQAVVAGLNVAQASKQAFIVDGSKGLVVGIQSVGDTMQRALLNSPRFVVEPTPDGNAQSPTPSARPGTAVSAIWSTRGGGTPRANKRKPKVSAEDKLKDFVEPQEFKPMEIAVEPAGGVTHVDGNGTVKKAEMRLPPGKINQDEYQKLVAKASSVTQSSMGGWFADERRASGDVVATPKIPTAPTVPNTKKPQSAQSARAYRR